MYIDSYDASDKALTVIQIIACVLIVIGFGLIIAYFMFTRCLKRRPEGPRGLFVWKCRRSTFKFKCFRRKANELKEPKDLPVPEGDNEDPNMVNSRRSIMNNVRSSIHEANVAGPSEY